MQETANQPATASATLGRRNILANAASSGLGHAAQLATAFFMFPLLVRALGDNRYGVWSLVESVLAYLTLMDFGIGAAVLRYVARFDECRDQEGLNRVFSASLCLFSGAGLLAWSIAAVLALAFDCPLGVPAEMAGDVRWLLLILGANLALGLPLGVFSTVLAGLGRYPLLNAVRTTSLVARMGLFLLVLHQGGGLQGLALAGLATSLAEHAVLMVAAFRRLPGLRFSLACCDRQTFRQVGGYSANAFVAMVAGRISFQTDSLLIGAFLFPGAITHFAIAARLVEYTKSSVRSLTNVLTPAFSALDARGDHEGIRRMFIQTTRYVLWIVLPVQSGFWLLGREFLTVWMGEAYAELSYPTLLILSLPLALAMSQTVAARILYGTGRIDWFSKRVLAEAFANLVLSLALVVPLGIEGVAWGTAIPNLVLNLVVARYLCRLLELSKRDYVRRAVLGPVLASLVPLALGVAFKSVWSVDGWTMLFVAGLSIYGPYAALAAWAELGTARLLGYLPFPVAGEALFKSWMIRPLGADKSV